MASVLSERRLIDEQGPVRRDLLIGLLGFALGAGATFLVWRQHATAPAADNLVRQQRAPDLDVGAAQKVRDVKAKTALKPDRAAPPTAVPPSARITAPAPAPTPARATEPLPPATGVATAAVVTPATPERTSAPAVGVPSQSALPAGTAPLQISVDNLFDGTGYNGTWHQNRRAPADTQVLYRLERRNERVAVTPASALHAAAQGARSLPLAASVQESLQWQLPRLTLRFDNKSGKQVSVTALEVNVRSSDADSTALPFVPSVSGGSLEFENLGWGKVQGAELSLGFAPAQQLDTLQPAAVNATQSIKLEDFDERLRVDLRQRLPAELRATGAAVIGKLSFVTASGSQRAVAFRTLVGGRGAASRRGRPLYFHHVLLRAGQIGVTVLPLAARVAPGKALEAKLRIASDRSVRQELTLTLKGADGTVLAAQAVDLEIFIPRSEAGGIVRTPSTLRAYVQ